MPASDPKKLHVKLIECYAALSEQKANGVCALYVEPAIDAWLLGEAEFSAFTKRAAAIENSDENFSKLLPQAKACLTKAPPADVKLNADEELALDVAAFIEQGKPYFEPALCQDKFGKSLNQTDILEISAYAQPEALKKAGGRAQLLEAMSVYSNDELLEFVNQLNELAQQANANFALSLACDGHRIGLAYDAAKKQWQLIDINQPHLKPVSAQGGIAQIAAAIKCAFRTEDEKYTDFNAKLFCRADHQNQLQPLVAALKANDKFKQLHEVTPERVERVTTRGVSLAWVMAKHGDAEGLQRIIALKNADGTPLANLNNNHIKTGFPPVHMAVQNNHPVATKVLMDARYSDGKRRVNVDHETTDGYRFVHQLAALGRVDTLKVLAEDGVNVTRQCYGLSPLDIAKDKKQQEVVAFFKAWNVRNQLIAEVNHLPERDILIHKVTQDFHDNHQRFLNPDFLHVERQGLRLLQKPVSITSNSLFAKKPVTKEAVHASQGCVQSCSIQ